MTKKRLKWWKFCTQYRSNCLECPLSNKQCPHRRKRMDEDLRYVRKGHKVFVSFRNTGLLEWRDEIVEES